VASFEKAQGEGFTDCGSTILSIKIFYPLRMHYQEGKSGKGQVKSTLLEVLRRQGITRTSKIRNLKGDEERG